MFPSHLFVLVLNYYLFAKIIIIITRTLDGNCFWVSIDYCNLYYQSDFVSLYSCTYACLMILHCIAVGVVCAVATHLSRLLPDYPLTHLVYQQFSSANTLILCRGI